MKKVAVILAGCGVYDGSEIHEAVFTLLEIAKHGGAYQCFAPNKDQLHVINHTNGEVMEENRNVLVESARIARGDVKPVSELKATDFDALAIPGGFGAAKNLNQWAISGPNGEIDAYVKAAIVDFAKNKKPIAAMCMGPTVVAKALEGSGIKANLSVGSTAEPSPYEIAAIGGGMESIGARVEEKTIREISLDAGNNIVCAPCYMMEGNIAEVAHNIHLAIRAMMEL